MKHTCLVICLLIVSSLFGGNAYAQGTEKRRYLTPAEDKPIRQFTTDFLQSLSQTKDIGLVPKRYFVPPFQSRILGGQWDVASPIPTVRYSRAERLRRSVLMFNFIYSGVLYSVRSYLKPGDLTAEEMYPPGVIRIIKKEPLLTPIMDTDFEPKDLKIYDPAKFYAGLVRLNVEFRKYLNSHPDEWVNAYNESVALLANDEIEKAFTFSCEQDECAGQPSHTPLIRAPAFPFYLTLIKHRGVIKILKIDIISDESEH